MSAWPIDINKMSKSSRAAFDEKLARANEAVKKEGFSELIAQARAAQKQKE